MMKYLIPVLTVGCAPFFETVDLACEGEFPGLEFISDQETIEAATRLNCYRRAARAPRLQIDETMQSVVEAHSDYLEAFPTRTAFEFQAPGTEGFTGRNPLERLDAANYELGNDAGYLFVTLSAAGDPVASFDGGYWYDFWWANPRVRADLMQGQVLEGGMDLARYVVPPPEEDIDPLSVEVMRHLFAIRTPSTPVPEGILSYPTNGQQDVPPLYQHLTASQGSELVQGESYGYPVVFTVGTTESGLSVDEAYFGRVGVEDGALAYSVLVGASLTSTFTNSVILIPSEPLEVGAEYQAIVTLRTNQGTRRKRVQFRAGGTPVVPPDGFNMRMSMQTISPTP